MCMFQLSLSLLMKSSNHDLNDRLIELNEPQRLLNNLFENPFKMKIWDHLLIKKLIFTNESKILSNNWSRLKKKKTSSNTKTWFLINKTLSFHLSSNNSRKSWKNLKNNTNFWFLSNKKSKNTHMNQLKFRINSSVRKLLRSKKLKS